MAFRVFAAILLTFTCVAMPVRAAPEPAPPLPAPVEAMIRAAADKGDGPLGATADVAKKAYPANAAQIDALVKGLRAVAAEKHKARLAHLGLLRGWKGQGQFGGSTSSGNTRTTGISAGLDFTREGLAWTHTLNATLDYERDNGVEDKSRYFASYQANYRFSENIYVLGLTSWEDDRFSGFHNRTTESLGFGWSILHGPGMTLSLEGGPALRQTNYVVGGAHDSFAPRGAVNYAWSILPNLKFTEQASYYSENRDNTFTTNTAFNIGLIGAMSVQAGYFGQYESAPPTLLKRYNGTARMTLVYSF